MIEQLKADLKTARTYGDLMGEDGAIKKLIKSSLEGMLDAELTEHLGYEKHSSQGKNSGNSRNGSSRKTLKNDNGEIDLTIPRDRNSTFDPVIVKKYERTLGPIEDKIISLYAKGMTTRDIQAHVHEMYGLDMSAPLVSQITDKIIDLAKQWHNRPLETVYPIVFFDAIHYKVANEGKVTSKAAYTCLAIDITGKKDLLGLWVAESEGANFWLGVMTELKNRGVNDILIACVDGLKGFPEAITTVFPQTEVQLCVIHLIRNTLKYIAGKDQKTFMRDLKTVYTAVSEEAALLALDTLENTWGKKYSLSLKIWRNNWRNASTFFKYPDEIRSMIYTTNAVEAVHRQFRKVTKSKSIFPHDDALKKMLFLAYRDIAKKWTVMPVKNWSLALSHLSIIFEKRLEHLL
ncbi:MAG: IS256 family transposase [Bacteroidales bacterium]|nr:IS256 family transposase [Bacteroidales bacterium]